MYRRLHPDGQTVILEIEGEVVHARAGESVAAAALAHGLDHTRTSVVSASPRAPWCMMGICFECLMEIDGVANRQACMVQVREGMVVRRQLGARDVAT